MSSIIAKYSDYAIQTIEFFRTAIYDELALRDLKGLTNGRVDMINISKQHPIVTMMDSQLAETRNADYERSNLLPAISVTPANPADIGFTLGLGYRTEIVDDDFIDIIKELQKKTEKEIQKDVLITKEQIENILGAYRKGTGTMKAQIHEWRKNEELNVSLWTETPDMDIMLGNVLDSILYGFRVGFAGDNSRLQNMDVKSTKGLTNFNFGRVLFGTEYSLTFMNTYCNYTIYSDDTITGHTFEPTTLIPGAE